MSLSSPQSSFEDKLLRKGYNLHDLSFLSKIMLDYSCFSFKVGRKFAFKPPKMIILGPYEKKWKALLLHEVGHAISLHRDYKVDVERLKMENEAWEKARELAEAYDVVINEDLIQDELETYRDWLHQKSRCPRCGLTRFQTPDEQYHCPLCDKF